MKSSTYMNTMVFEVLTMVAIEDTIFWDRGLTPCVLVEVHRLLRGTCCLHLYV